ncbi:MAG: TonB-dependent receptor [Pirellulaceae bacterium]|nr:TonB-dependent receptor [Pirellulaceae bacterium]
MRAQTWQLTNDPPVSESQPLPAVSAAAYQQPDDGQPLEIPETVVQGEPGGESADLGQSQPVQAPTGNERPLSETASSVTVLTREDIQRTAQNTVAEVLRGTVGLDVVRQGGPGGVTSVFLRGANSQQTKVLIDGMPVNDPSNATRGFDFSTLLTDNIERIEVLRGPQSILYGSDAIGGVVNIITRRGEGPPQARFRLNGGSFGTADQAVSVSGGNASRYYSLDAAFLHTDGISAASSRLGNTERDRYQNLTLSGRVGWNPRENLNIDYSIRYTDADAEIDQFDFLTGLPTDAFPGANLTRALYNRLQFQLAQLDGTLTHTVSLNLTDYARRDTSAFAFVPAFDGQTRTVNYRADLLLTENNTFSVGTGYLNEDAATDAAYSQHNAHVFLLDEQQWGERFYLTFGYRWDDWNTAGPAQTYRLTGLLRFDETGTAVRSSLGTGFRAPALAENLFEFGNPDLRPEQSRGWDVGLEQQLFGDRVLLSGTYFRNDFTDLIVFDFNTFSLQNVGRARTSGVEVVANWQADAKTTLGATYTLTDTLDLDADRPLLRRPRDKASLQIHRRLCCDRALLSGYLLYVGDRLDTGDAVLDRYLTVNVSGHYELTPTCRLIFRGDNLFDEQYEEVNGFGTPGISGYGGLSLVW